MRFEYGKTTKYGKKTALESLTPGFGGRAVSAGIAGFRTGTVVHYRVLVATADGSAAGRDQKFTVGSKDHTPPKLSKLSVSPKRFAVSSKRTAVSAKKKVPHGTAFRLKVSEKSSVTFSIALKTTGRKVKKTIRKKGSRKKSVKTVCAARGHHRVTKKTRCTLYVAVGTLRRSLKTGAHMVAFSGRIGRKALKPGTYRVTIRATDAAKNRSKTSTLTFTVVRG